MNWFKRLLKFGREKNLTKETAKKPSRVMPYIPSSPRQSNDGGDYAIAGSDPMDLLFNALQGRVETPIPPTHAPYEYPEPVAPPAPVYEPPSYSPAPSYSSHESSHSSDSGWSSSDSGGSSDGGGGGGGDGGGGGGD